MLALSPPSFPTFGWPLEEPISHDLNYILSREPETPQSFPYYNIPSISQDQDINHIENDSPSFIGNYSDLHMVKKLNHNASERDRRKKINTLYSSLRSLLPASDQSKKLSIPGTVSRVLRYIPELQQQVERQTQKKEELLSKISKQDNLIHQENQRQATVCGSLSAVSSNWLGEKEVMVQISTYKHHNSPLSSILPSLEEDGIFLLSCSSFESFGGRVFYNLHLQVENARKFEGEPLSKKIASLYDNKKEMFLP